MPSRFRGRKGFTLIEALIALFLLAIAAVSLGPIYQEMSRKAREKETKARLLAVRKALLDYYQSALEGRRSSGGTPTSFLPSEESFWDDLRPFLASIRSEDLSRDAWHRTLYLRVYEPSYGSSYCPLKAKAEGHLSQLPKVLIVSSGNNGRLESSLPSEGDDIPLDWAPSGDDLGVVVSFIAIDAQGRDFDANRLQDIASSLKNYFMTNFIKDSQSQGPSAVNNDYYANFFGSGGSGSLPSYAASHGNFLGYSASQLRDFWGNDLYFKDNGGSSPPYSARVWTPCGDSIAVPGII